MPAQLEYSVDHRYVGCVHQVIQFVERLFSVLDLDVF